MHHANAVQRREDEQAQDALDLLADVARCPECHRISDGTWRRFDGHEVGLCTTAQNMCDVVYFRRDAKRLYVNAEVNRDGRWIWSNGRRR